MAKKAVKKVPTKKGLIFVTLHVECTKECTKEMLADSTLIDTSKGFVSITPPDGCGCVDATISNVLV